jgi:uncharacterized protein
MRLLIFLGLIYLCYRALKSWLFPNSAVSKTAVGQAADAIDDVMIKDPVCEIYFPKRDGIHLQADGQDLYFCSTECRDQFLASRSKE